MTQTNDTTELPCPTEECTCTVAATGTACDPSCDIDGSGACGCGHDDCEATAGLEIEQSVFDPHTVGESMTAPTARLDVDPPSESR